MAKLEEGEDPREVIEGILGQSLLGPAGNAYAVMGLTRSYLAGEGFERQAINALMKDVTSGDYENLLRVCAEALLEA